MSRRMMCGPSGATIARRSSLPKTQAFVESKVDFKLACSRLLERRAKERARGRKRRGWGREPQPPSFSSTALSPSPSPSRFSLGAWNRLISNRAPILPRTELCPWNVITDSRSNLGKGTKMCPTDGIHVKPLARNKLHTPTPAAVLTFQPHGEQTRVDWCSPESK